MGLGDIKLGDLVTAVDALGLYRERAVVQSKYAEKNFLHICRTDLMPACQSIQDIGQFVERFDCIHQRYHTELERVKKVQNNLEIPLRHAIYSSHVVGATNVGFITNWLWGQVCVMRSIDNETSDMTSVTPEFYNAKAKVNEPFLKLCELSKSHEQDRHEWLMLASSTMYISLLWAKDVNKVVNKLVKNGHRDEENNAKIVNELEPILNEIWKTRSSK